MKKICVIFLAALLLMSAVSCSAVQKIPGIGDLIATDPPDETQKQEEPVQPTEAPPTEEVRENPITIKLPDLPLQCEYGSESVIKILEIEYTVDFSESYGTGDVTIEYRSEVVSGSGTYGFSVKLLQGGDIVKTGSISVTGSLDPGETYRKSFTITSLPAGDYELAISDKKDD